ncbi:Uncharacterised protein [Mycobacterium tuberculosis]|uniref:Uncharacterized protein n=1 Tax=Mycobacterium tuberculosis TaxID=1773 RepID=A0A916PCL1_MYCTX|nr:Uncharacterised protein [Mycobacterium tuberculosis]COX29074.1 Uncharacterised protein [Mycobacterium tuberculosis]COZ13682.1 Uncharacterised protein [Mycobacterium tuberculosis]
MLDAVRVRAAFTPGSPSLTSDSMLGMVSLIAATTESVPLTAIGAGGCGKTRPANFAAAALKPVGSTANGSAIAGSPIRVPHRANFTGRATRSIAAICRAPKVCKPAPCPRCSVRNRQSADPAQNRILRTVSYTPVIHSSMGMMAAIMAPSINSRVRFTTGETRRT